MTKFLFILLFQTQTASYYGKGFIGRHTANGELYTGNDMTTAHKTLPFGTRVRITNIENNKTIIVRVNDRGPFIGKRSFDLSVKAFESLTTRSTGLIKISVEILDSINLPYLSKKKFTRRFFKKKVKKVFLTVVQRKPKDIVEVQLTHIHLFNKCFIR